MRKPNGSARKLGYERLEARLVLNGTVTASLPNPGELHLDGDGVANILSIHQVGNSLGGANIQVIGAATKINNTVPGTPATGYVFTFTGVNTLVIDLAGGNDVLKLYNTTVTGEVDIVMGAGNDVLTMTNVRSTVEESSIQMGDGTNVAAFTNVSVNGFNFNGGSGRDIVALNSVNTGSQFNIDLHGGSMNTLTVVNCSADEGSFKDDGSDGIVTGVRNHFGAQTIVGFKFRSGDLMHDEA
jgi:hypothetical protein